MRLRLLACVAATLLGGCSLILDNDSLLGDAGAALPDGGRSDAGPDAGEDAPTAPVVSITPDVARTADTLSAQIDTESVDPLDMGIDRYEYTWLRDDAPSGDTGTDVDAASTSKGEVWTVEVVGVTVDGRRSPPGTAMITIANTPPELVTVGLSHYRPIEGDLIEALPGAVVEPDEEPTSLRYEWYVDGELLTGQTTGRLSLTPALAPAGSEVGVRVFVTDDEEETGPAAAGNAVVVTNEPRWHRLLPDRSHVFASVFDRSNDRVVAISRFVSGEEVIFEYDLETGRFVTLPPLSAEVEVVGAPPVQAGDRAYVNLRNEGRLDIQEYDVSNRGSESLTPLSLDETALTATVEEVIGNVFDRRTNRLIIGTLDDAMNTNILAVDMSATPPAATELAVDVPSIPNSASWIVHEERNAIVILGGDTGTGSPVDEIRVMPLDDPASLTISTLRLPSPAIFPVAGYSPSGGQIVFGYGLESISSGAGSEELHRLDLTTQTVEQIDTSATPGRGLWGWIDVDRQGRLLMSRDQNGAPLGGGDFEVIEIDTATWATRYIHETGADLPGELGGGTAWIEIDELRVWGGQTGDDSASPVAWRFVLPEDQRLGTISEISLTDDAGRGRPMASYGQASSTEIDPFVWGGRSDASTVLGGSAWRLDGNQWREQPLTTATVPPPRAGAVLMPGCGPGFSVFGGRTNGGSANNELWVLQCPTPDTACAWTQPTITGSIPAVRSGPAVYDVRGGPVVMYGVGSGYPTDGYQINVCTAESVPVVLAGDLPPPRAGSVVVGDLLFGGDTSGGPLNDTYTLSFDQGTRTVTFTEHTDPPDSVGRPAPRSEALVAHGEFPERVLLYGGRTRSTFGGLRYGFSDLWEFRGLP